MLEFIANKVPSKADSLPWTLPGRLERVLLMVAERPRSGVAAAVRPLGWVTGRLRVLLARGSSQRSGRASPRRAQLPRLTSSPKDDPTATTVAAIRDSRGGSLAVLVRGLALITLVFGAVLW